MRDHRTELSAWQTRPARWLGALLAIAALVLPAGSARAEYPDKPITFIVGLAAGGGVDTYARTLAALMQKDLGKPINIVNKTGGGQVIALKAFLEQKPDGYTLFFHSGTTSLVTHIQGRAPASPITDMRTVGSVGALSAALCVPAASPFKSAKDVVEAIRKQPGKLRWGHPGRGSNHHLSGAGFLAANKLVAQDVPTKGGSKARVLLAANQVDFGFIGIQLITGFEAKIRCLGVVPHRADPVLSSYKPLNTQGFKSPDVSTPMVLAAPKGTPDAIYDKLVKAAAKAAKSPEFDQILRRAGLGAAYMSPKEAVDYLKTVHGEIKPLVSSTLMGTDKGKK
ncbi:MAG: tripartite tricarboxylate transporter substrate binding protein [Hyphomicrobiaceae bacterium]|nr:tripartite tricarboxylate transporter substrate binding protein [Hyphomicrobiaceae bacterium]